MERLSTQSKKQGWLSWFLRGVLILGLIILVGRLGELQIIKGDYYRGLSDNNRLRRVPIPAPRGRILANDGQVLVDNSEVKKKVNFFPSTGYELSDDITGASNEEIISDWVRDYKFGKVFAHVTGYIGAVNASEVGKINPNCSEKGPRENYDLVGRTGLERYYDCSLAGIDGEELIEVNTQGKKVRILGRRDPIPGQDLKTTLDVGLQKTAYDALEGKKSAAVISDTKGNILALVSEPSFDPNDFVGQKNNQNINSYFKNPDLPLFNRAIDGLFHPGSVFKPIVAIAALESGKIDQNYTFNDTGQITVNNFTYRNWYFTEYGKTEGEIGLTKAIARSTDTFFYKVGELTGIETLASWANKFNLGSTTGIDLPSEASGLVPTPEWKQKVKNEQWFLGNTYNVSIGQGDLAVTPVEENAAISAIAANGTYCQPHINAGFQPKCTSLNINPKNITLVKAGMTGACTQGGTGYTFFDFSPQVACKTGTAETSEDGEPHAWFTLMAPVDSTVPSVIVTIVVERGGQGATVAGPIARKIMDYWKSTQP